MNLAQIIKYEGDNQTFVWKHPCEDFNTLSQLIVHESQEALFFANGQALDLFGPGRYTLKTENIPILRKLQSIPTNGETPFHCEVYFINKTVQMAVKWGTDSKVEYSEPTYGFPIRIGASGELSLRAEDSRKLLVKLVGTENDLSQEHLMSYFRGIIMTHVKPYIAQIMRTSKISIFEADEHISEFSEALREKLAPDFLDYGMTLERFFITNISKPEDDPNYNRFKNLFFEESIGLREEKLQQQRELIRQQTESQRIVMKSAAIAQKRSQEGYTYQQERGYDVAAKAAENEGAGNFTAPGIGLGMMAGIGGGMGAAVAGIAKDAFAPLTQPIPAVQPQAAGPAAPGPASPAAQPETAAPAAEKPAAQPETAVPAANPQPESADPLAEFRQKVQKLTIMKESGIISDEEFAQLKAKLLESI